MRGLRLGLGLNSQLDTNNGAGGDPDLSRRILREDNTSLLLEDGTYLLLEL